MVIKRLISKNTRPGRIVYVLFMALILTQFLVVELCEGYLAPFDGFWLPGNWERVTGISLGTLRIIFVLASLVVLGTALISLRQPRQPVLLLDLIAQAMRESIVSMIPDRTPFLFAYMGLNVPTILGFILFAINGNRLDFYGFAIPGLVGLLLLWTQTARWDRFAAMAQAELDE